MTARTVLVTGAAGFVGTPAVESLLARGFTVHGVGRRQTSDQKQINWHSADLLDPAASRALIEKLKPTHLLHCAWETRHGHFWNAPENLDWVAASLGLLRTFVNHGGRRAVFVGSCAEYDWAHEKPLREDDACHPSTLYGTAKHALFDLAGRFAEDSGIGFAWGRLFHLIGAGDQPERLIPELARTLADGRKASIKNGSLVRDYMDIRDAGAALAALVNANVTGPVNIASGQGISLGQLGAKLASLAGCKDRLTILNESAQGAEPPALVADIGRLRTELEFKPEYSLDQSLKAVLAQYQKRQPVKLTTEALRKNLVANIKLKNFAEAVTFGEQLVAAEPDSMEAHNNLGIALRRTGRPAEAIKVLQRAVIIDPKAKAPWVNLGNAAREAQQLPLAIEAFGKAAAFDPPDPEIYRLLGNVQMMANVPEPALANLGRALELAPNAVTIRADRSRALFSIGRFAEALADIDLALKVSQPAIEHLVVRATILRRLGRVAEAIAYLRDAADKAPDQVELFVALGDAQLAIEDRPAANASYRAAVALDPDHLQAGAKLVWSLLNSRYDSEAKHTAEAASLARDLLARGKPLWAIAHPLQSALLRTADFANLAKFNLLFADKEGLYRYWLATGAVGALHSQLGRVENLEDRLALVDAHRKWGERVEGRVTPLNQTSKTHQPSKTNQPSNKRRKVTTAKIRVGLMSSDLRNHPVSYFALSLIDHYDPDQVDLFGYSFYPLAADPVQRHIAQKLSLTVMPQASDAEIAQRIADDRLDMLVELGGSTHLNRLDVMAWRPAPVQTSWLGYPHSAGLSRIDYIVTDPYIEPEDKRLLIEQPLRLPESWVSIDRLGFGDMPIDPVLPEDRLGFLTFGTANNPYKYSGHCIALWAQIMLAVPDSKFLFIRPEGDVPAFRDNLAAAFAQHGIERNRLAYAPVRGKHLPFYNKMDIALDTLPHTGGTTTCESLWMGVPTVTKIGPAFFERLSFSNLTNAGLGDLCARSDEAYVETAIGLAADKARRQELRQGLRAQIRANPLGQPARFAAGFFNAIGQVLD